MEPLATTSSYISLLYPIISWSTVGRFIGDSHTATLLGQDCAEQPVHTEVILSWNICYWCWSAYSAVRERVGPCWAPAPMLATLFTVFPDVAAKHPIQVASVRTHQTPEFHPCPCRSCRPPGQSIVLPMSVVDILTRDFNQWALNPLGISMLKGRWLATDFFNLQSKEDESSSQPRASWNKAVLQSLRYHGRVKVHPRQLKRMVKFSKPKQK